MVRGATRHIMSAAQRRTPSLNPQPSTLNPLPSGTSPDEYRPFQRTHAKHDLGRQRFLPILGRATPENPVSYRATRSGKKVRIRREEIDGIADVGKTADGHRAERHAAHVGIASHE